MQHDLTVDNSNGLTVLADLNSALQALASNNSGATEPTTTFPLMWWSDTANDLLKQRNAANSAWISVLTLSSGKAINSAAADFALNGIPPGTQIDFCGTTAPTGFLVIPVAPTNISRTTYAALFAAIGTVWGAGDGSTTFGMPYCPANYASVQSSGNVGTSTVGENLTHSHDATQRSSTAGAGAGYTTIGSGAVGPGSIALGNSGGSANLAAGIRLLKCVKH